MRAAASISLDWHRRATHTLPRSRNGLHPCFPDCRLFQLPGFKEVFAKHMGDKFRAAAFGIAVDRTPQIMWRMTHGEIPKVGKKLEGCLGCTQPGAMHASSLQVLAIKK